MGAFLGILFAFIILFAFAMHHWTLRPYADGQLLYGTVREKERVQETQAKGGTTTYNYVFVDFEFEGVDQIGLLEDYITNSQWEGLNEGDSVAFIYLPDRIYLDPDGRLTFYDPPILEAAYRPALRRLDFYPLWAGIALLLGFVPGIRVLLRRRFFR